MEALRVGGCMDLDASVIMTCWRIAAPGDMGPSPRVDLIVRGVPILTDRADRCTVPAAAEVFRAQVDSFTRIYVLCDRHAEGAKPPHGVIWDEDTRDKCARVGLMACVAWLMQEPLVKSRFERDQATLAVGMLDGSKAVLIDGLGAELIAYVLRD